MFQSLAVLFILYNMCIRSCNFESAAACEVAPVYDAVQCSGSTTVARWVNHGGSVGRPQWPSGWITVARWVYHSGPVGQPRWPNWPNKIQVTYTGDILIFPPWFVLSEGVCLSFPRPSNICYSSREHYIPSCWLKHYV